jgi:hypothetical protein
MLDANHGSVRQASFHPSFGQAFNKEFRGKAVIAVAFLLRATRRGFDIKSNRRRSACIRIASPCFSDLRASFTLPTPRSQP